MEGVVNKNIRRTLYPLQILTAGANEVTFTVDKEIRDAKRIIKIEALTNTQVGFTPNKLPVVNDVVFKNSSIELVNRDSTTIAQIALPTISKSNNTFFIEPINIEGISLEKCKVVIGNPTGVVAGEAFLFAITYEK